MLHFFSMMALSWNWAEDRQWSGSPYHMQISSDESVATWVLEVCQGVAVLGQIRLKGSIKGELRMAIEQPDYETNSDAEDETDS